MESIVKNTLVVKLVLNASEASVLKSIVQNALCENEPEHIAKVRHDIFHAIPDFEELHKAED